MKILIHACCAHCFDATLYGLEQVYTEAVEPVGYFFNPNIHPLLEFRKRLKAFQVLNERLKLPVYLEESYGLKEFMDKVWSGGKGGRCRRCYLVRLMAAARKARSLDIPSFTSSLCVSAHQDHENIAAAGEEAGKSEGCKYLYHDLRAAASTCPRRPGIYAQQYCGCVFSEEERYAATSKELYRGSGGGGLGGN